jgi:hypothetical protein
MYCGWWLPGTPGIPVAGMLVQDDRVPPAGGLEGGQVAGLAPRRLGAPHDPPQPSRPVGGGPAGQVRDLGDMLVLLDMPVLVQAGLPG